MILEMKKEVFFYVFFTVKVHLEQQFLLVTNTSLY